MFMLQTSATEVFLPSVTGNEEDFAPARAFKVDDLNPTFFA